MSIEESFAARRRTSCSRWAADSRGSGEISIVYAPPDASVQRSAISAWPPRVRVDVPGQRGSAPASPPPQAARVPAVTRSVAAPATHSAAGSRDLRSWRPSPSEAAPDRQSSTSSHRLRWRTRGLGVTVLPESGAGHKECQFERSRGANRGPTETGTAPSVVADGAGDHRGRGDLTRASSGAPSRGRTPPPPPSRRRASPARRGTSGAPAPRGTPRPAPAGRPGPPGSRPRRAGRPR